MRELPILFSAPMVRALLADTKTQTRRIMKPQPTQPRQAGYILHSNDRKREGGFQWSDSDCKNLSEPVHCPYGQPGDRLWVRETCRAEEPFSGLNGVRYLADNYFRQIENTPEAAERWGKLYHYGKRQGATVTPIHAPRWASRILLEVVSVRVERLQDIGESDAVAEGITWSGSYSGYVVDEEGHCYHGSSAVRSYEKLWASINGPDSWDANPYVWVVEFQRLPPTTT